MEEICSLYSESIYAFIKEIKQQLLKIIQEEMGLRATKKRFIYKNYSYPINVIVFEHPQRLGYFYGEYYEIGVHKRFLYIKEKKALKDLLRHELAHFICFIDHNESFQDHGREFRSICKRYSWGKEVYLAKTFLPKDEAEKQIQLENRILPKVQKLLSLASSSFGNEAKSALLKANSLLQKHNLEKKDLNEEEFVAKKILFEKKASSKLQAIATILRQFFVIPVYNKGLKEGCLELFGSREHVEVAEYIGHFLYHDLEKLWKKAKLQSPNLKGIGAKNAFFRGIAKGYTEKMQKSSADKALIATEKKLELETAKAFPLLYTKKSSYQQNEDALSLGKKEGKTLSIKKGMEKKESALLLFCK